MAKKGNTDNKDGIRINWGKDYSLLPKLDLLQVQKQSYKWFLDKGIKQVLEEISPIDDFTEKNWTLELKDYRLGKISTTPENALAKGITYDSPLYVNATLTNKKTNATYDQEVFLGDIPQMTERGTFIINGIERAVVNQLVRSPGSFFTASADNVTGKTLYNAEIRPVHGSWLEFTTTRHETIMVKIDRRRKFLATTFLRALGISSNEDIKSRFAHAEANGKTKYIENTVLKDETQDSNEALIEIFRKMHPGEPVVLDKVRENFLGTFFNNRRYDLGAVGRYKMNKKLSTLENFNVPSLETKILTLDDIVGTISFLIKLAQG